MVPKGQLQRRQWQPTLVLLLGESHGWRSLVGCSPWGRQESDTTDRLDFHFSLSCIGEGNGHPLHCSFLENPRDRGEWWAAVYGVAQSWTWLKWLSSSSICEKQFQNSPTRVLCVQVLQSLSLEFPIKTVFHGSIWHFLSSLPLSSEVLSYNTVRVTCTICIPS